MTRPKRLLAILGAFLAFLIPHMAFAVAPTADSLPGATIISTTGATLNGHLLTDGGAATTVQVYWGIADGGTVPANWGNTLDLGATTPGVATQAVTGLLTGTKYFYRFHATNADGDA